VTDYFSFPNLAECGKEKPTSKLKQQGKKESQKKTLKPQASLSFYILVWQWVKN